MLPMPAIPAIAANGVPSKPGRSASSSAAASGSSSSCCMAAPSVVASASSTGFERDEVQVDPALRADGRERGGERRGESGLADHERLRRVRELLELLVVRGPHRRIGPTLERDPLGGLSGHLPIDGSGRLQDPHHLTQVDLGEVDVGRIEVARTAEQEGRKARNAGFVGLLGVSRLRRVGHAVSVWGCIPLRSPAPPDSSGVTSFLYSPRILTSIACSDSTCASPNGVLARLNSRGSTSPAPS